VSEVSQSPYAVALRLAEVIAFAEKKPLRTAGSAAEGVNREYVLKLYRDCLEAVGSQGAALQPRG